MKSPRAIKRRRKFKVVIAKPKPRISKSLGNAQEVYEYIFKTMRPQHMTLKDLKRLKIGQSIDVVLWDRNWNDWLFTRGAFGQGHIKPNVPTDVRKFFKKNRHQIVYKGGNKWEIRYPFGKSIVHPVEVNLCVKGKETWGPVENGKTCKCQGKPRKINGLPDSTRIGWRGPMALWSSLKAGKVYWDEDFPNEKKYFKC